MKYKGKKVSKGRYKQLARARNRLEERRRQDTIVVHPKTYKKWRNIDDTE